jgi:hypothetical protein
MNLAAGVGVTAAVFMMAVLGFLAKPRENQVGSVSDLVKRGQLRSDRGAEYVLTLHLCMQFFCLSFCFMVPHFQCAKILLSVESASVITILE